MEHFCIKLDYAVISKLQYNDKILQTLLKIKALILSKHQVKDTECVLPKNNATFVTLSMNLSIILKRLRLATVKNGSLDKLAHGQRIYAVLLTARVSLGILKVTMVTKYLKLKTFHHPYQDINLTTSSKVATAR